jgi:hypothetical protein
MHFNPKPRGIEGNEKAGSAPAGNPAAESSSSNLGFRALGGGALPSSRGVALVITLIMLSVITFMAVTFLVLSHRERGSVTTTTDQTSAGFTAESALERAKAEILARIVALTNDQNYDLIVSTNFINYGGFDPGAVDYRTNVNYDHLANGNPVTGNNALQNLANLFYNPRPPVFIVTNRQSPNNTDFRFYLDLNRNGRYDTNGFQPEIGINGKTNGTINFYVGDPEWIGVLEHPDQPHSANNKFVARYAYIVLPAGKTLDVNYIHNQAVSRALNTATDGYARNQGVGSWEINLAALLADLNTNQWDRDNGLSALYYQYNRTNLLSANSGYAFEDALAFLNYRYGQNYATLMPATSYFPNNAAVLRIDNIDEYSDGPLMTGNAINEDGGLNPDPDPVSAPWVGADNTNHYFTPQDFFDPTKTSGFFTNRLLIAGTNADSYDRYTFYRMLAQLGTDSTPEQNKINLNYKNVDSSGNVVPGMETNLIPWPPLQLFTNAAQRIFAQLNLHDGYGNLITVTNIPLYPTNYYTPAVHRVLQLAANMFEATTNGPYPSIYRPYFNNAPPIPGGTNIIISGYQLVNGPTDPVTDTTNYWPTANPMPYDVSDATNRGILPSALWPNLPSPPNRTINVYGAPWVIGARKGFPNLNEIVMQSVSQITRKLRVQRPNPPFTDFSKFHTTQLIMAGISNTIGVEVWNSYSNNYSRPVYILADGNLSMTLTNDLGYIRSLSYPLGGLIMGATNVPALNWQGTGWQPGVTAPANPQSFLVPLLTNVVFLPDSAYQVNPPPGLFWAVPTNGTQIDWFSLNTDGLFPQPQWGLNITNRIRCMIFDGGPGGRVIDYVQLNGLNSYRNLAAEIYSSDPSVTNTWSTNAVTSFLGLLPMPEGVNNQIYISAGQPDVGDVVWANNMMSAPIGPTREWAIDYFRVFLGLNPEWYPDLQNTQLVMQVPFAPTAKNYQLLAWEANDPLVHYTAGDLTYPAVTNIYPVQPPNASFSAASSNFWRYTDRYDPWGGNPSKGSVGDKFAYLTALKDPLVRASDDWDLPTNKFPNVGWLGRMHRGTPWQTVYLKSATNPIAMWTNWSGDMVNWIIGGTNYADASFSHPINDRQLFDLFTTAVDDNATRGQLSVNQANLAAWSAVLSGVIVLTNSSATVISPLLINPAGVYNPAQPPPIVRIVQGINNTRTNFLNNSFSHLGDILATPQLTEQSPFLNINNLQTLQAGGVNDEAMERIPQQILGLLNLSHTPRFVIYSYGQTLHPADHSIITYGTYFGLCTNYQVTAESATRTVVRVEGAPANPHVVVEQFNVLPPD